MTIQDRAKAKLDSAYRRESEAFAEMKRIRSEISLESSDGKIRGLITELDGWIVAHREAYQEIRTIEYILGN
jgi:hypothetical protein